MGIISFQELENYLGNNNPKRGLNEFRGNIAIIDTAHRLLKQCIGRCNNTSTLTNSKGKLSIHLYVTFITIMGMFDNGIQPFFVFEGKNNQSSDKAITCAERRKVKENAKKKCDEIENKTSPEYFKYLKKCFQLTHDHYNEVKYLLDLAGIPYIVAPGEGDPQCAALSKYYKLPVISDDPDILVFGGVKMLKDFSLSEKTTCELNKQTIIQQLFLKAIDICEKHELPQIEEFTHDNFVDYCIMLGTDYTPNNIKAKISGSTVVELFELFVINELDVEKTCEYIKTHCPKIRVSPNFIDSWRHIKNKYINYPVIHPDSVNMQLKKPNIEKLIEFLCDENEFDRAFVTKKIFGFANNYKLYTNMHTEALNCENEFENFSSYRLKYGKQRVNREIRSCSKSFSYNGTNNEQLTSRNCNHLQVSKINYPSVKLKLPSFVTVR